MAANRLDTQTAIVEFTEFRDVVMRVATTRGSTPLLIVDNGEVVGAEQIGQSVLDLFRYTVRSDVFDAAKGAVAV